MAYTSMKGPKVRAFMSIFAEKCGGCRAPLAAIMVTFPVLVQTILYIGTKAGDAGQIS